MSINENLLNEKINQLKKGLEIIGADKKLYSKSNSDIINNIYAGINRTYRLDINKLLLSSIVNIENISDLDEQEQYYGDYLNQKRKQIIDGVVSKVGIV